MQMKIRNRVVESSEWPLVMGILNVTPDSFSDGGMYADPHNAVEHGLRMIADGADIIDVGPESTRPGAEVVAAAVQNSRAVPVIQALRARDPEIPISIDTRLAPVAWAAIEAGADLVNDVSALQDDPDMVSLVAESNLPVVLMHRRGTPQDMQKDGGPHYDDVVEEIRSFLSERRRFVVDRGVSESQIILDPGIGFGKRIEHNLVILRSLDCFAELGSPLLVGASRKRFIGNALGLDNPQQCEAGSLACAVIAALSGTAIIRVHDVASTVGAVRLCRGVKRAGAGE